MNLSNIYTLWQIWKFLQEMYQIYHFLQSAKWCNIFCVELFVSPSWLIFCHWIPGQSEPSAVSTISWYLVSCVADGGEFLSLTVNSIDNGPV